MISTGCNYPKLKANLRLAINRLKFLEKKKTEIAQKSRREIADYLANGKLERSKIRVEHIIREDYLVEAMEVVEMYCDLILARFGLIQQMKTLDAGLETAISSLMWAAPRLQTDVAELKVIAEQLAVKYGKQYALAAKENALNIVNEKLVHTLSVQAPPKILVEKYLIEIAKSHNVSYEPEAQEETEKAICNLPLIEFDDIKHPETGFVTNLLPDDKSIYPQRGLPTPFNYQTPIVCTKAKVSATLPSAPFFEPTANTIVFNYDLPASFYKSIFGTKPSLNNSSNNAPTLPSPATICPVDSLPAPATICPDSLPELPAVPNTLPSDSYDPNDDDFDELAKRLENLKKWK